MAVKLQRVTMLFKIPKDKDDKLCNFETKVGSTIFQKKKPKISVPVKVIAVIYPDKEP